MTQLKLFPIRHYSRQNLRAFRSTTASALLTQKLSADVAGFRPTTTTTTTTTPTTTPTTFPDAAGVGDSAGNGVHHEASSSGVDDDVFGEAGKLRDSKNERREDDFSSEGCPFLGPLRRKPTVLQLSELPGRNSVSGFLQVSDGGRAGEWMEWRWEGGWW